MKRSDPAHDGSQVPLLGLDNNKFEARVTA